MCLKQGHQQTDCKANKVCVHCQEKNRHHRSLCSKTFPTETPPETPPEIPTDTVNTVTEPEQTIIAQDNYLLASDEQVLMQTATTEVEDLNKTNKQTVSILLDTGSHRTYITEELAKILQLKVNGSETLIVYTFSSTKPRKLQTHVTELRLLTKDGSSLHLRVNVVPKITGTLQRTVMI